MSLEATVGPYRDNFEHLADELSRLDRLIRLRSITLPLQNRPLPQTQLQRTVYITAEEVDWLLAQDEIADPPQPDADEARREVARSSAQIANRVERSLEAGAPLRLPALGQLFGLSAFELQVVVICLAPELRRKYDRLYAYLQDDITRKRPSVDLVLELLCETDAERWQARSVFDDVAPLLRTGLLQKAEDPQSPSGSSGLAQFLKVDIRICQFLLGSNQIDGRLVDDVRLSRPSSTASEPIVEPTVASRALRLVEHHLRPEGQEGRKLVLYLKGPSGVGKRALASYVCRHLQSSTLSLDVEAILARGPEAERQLRLAFREGLLQQAVLYLERADALLQDAARPLLKTLEVAVAESGWLVFLSGEAPWTAWHTFTGTRFQPITLPIPDVSLRLEAWQRCLAGRAPTAETWAPELAARFRLTPGQIRAAAELANNRHLMAPDQHELTLGDLAGACREQSAHKLSELAMKIEPRHGWGDLVLPEEKLAQLQEIASQVRYHDHVFGTWGFGKKLSHGKGLSALFTGPPGTGKTLAAEVLAGDLELDLYKVDLTGVVSKYIGETEKNLARVFHEAEASNAILFFDEADALFGKRTEVSDAHDRYANIETSYLLQKMEAYQGIVILATNLRENLDEAFTRRIRFVVEFPFPDEEHRRRIWQTHFPSEAPVSSDVDYTRLAREFPVAGGSIKNIVLHAAFLAAADGGEIQPGHVLHGAQREYEKMGKLWTK